MSEKLPKWSYWATVVKIIDGDTYELDIDVGFAITVRERFRLMGVNTPEVFGVKKTSTEYAAGMAASSYVKSILPAGAKVEVRTYKDREKYGRWLCDVYLENGDNIAELITRAGHNTSATTTNDMAKKTANPTAQPATKKATATENWEVIAQWSPVYKSERKNGKIEKTLIEESKRETVQRKLTKASAEKIAEKLNSKSVREIKITLMCSLEDATRWIGAAYFTAQKAEQNDNGNAE